MFVEDSVMTRFNIIVRNVMIYVIWDLCNDLFWDEREKWNGVYEFSIDLGVKNVLECMNCTGGGNNDCLYRRRKEKKISPIFSGYRFRTTTLTTLVLTSWDSGVRKPCGVLGSGRHSFVGIRAKLGHRDWNNMNIEIIWLCTFWCE